MIVQKHINFQKEKWAALDLQIGLLKEHEVTMIMTVVTAIARKMEVEVADDKEIEVLPKIYIDKFWI